MATDKMDRGLDEIIADKRSNGPRPRRGGGGGGRGGSGGDRRNDRQDYPRDGVKKSFRNESRNLDSEWVHDRYEENNYRREPAQRRHRESPTHDARGAKLRVENIHYDLTEEDLDELFRRIGPITKLQLRYDRSGRSEGTAFVIYEEKEDAVEAVKQFDGANANGQPIRLTLLTGGPSRNPFDTAVMPGRPLAERISAPGGGRSRSLSPPRRYDADDAARKGIDRYVPGSGSRSRSPMPPRRGGAGGRRPGARREAVGSKDQEAVGTRGGRGGRGARGDRSTPRPKKTQEELDAEMEDYFSGNAAAPAEAAADSAAAPAPTENATAAAPALIDDVDMIE
ncbi:THO complex subunit 4A [Cladobotryum mycophilum]|uniref:THO complex subunit 4A n=1 Tax=Cladobotryum mycophilum TaxID=491253 RepID=A0ABR0SES3_9HYPO